MKFALKYLILIVLVLVLLNSSSVVSAESVTTRYVGNLAEVKDGEVSFKVNDLRGSTRVVVNASDGDIIARSHTLPYGQSIQNEDSRFDFTGKELDATGNHYFNARYYDSDLGKFLSVDPVEDNHAYAYVSNNPYKFIDPDGMDIIFSDKSVASQTVSSLNRDIFSNSQIFGYSEIDGVYHLTFNNEEAKKYYSKPGFSSTNRKDAQFLLNSISALINAPEEIEVYFSDELVAYVDFENFLFSDSNRIKLGINKDSVDFVKNYGKGFSEISFNFGLVLIHELGHAFGFLDNNVVDLVKQSDHNIINILRLNENYGANYGEGIAVGFENRARRLNNMNERKFYTVTFLHYVGGFSEDPKTLKYMNPNKEDLRAIRRRYSTPEDYDKGLYMDDWGFFSCDN